MPKKIIRIYYVFDKQFQLKCTGVCMIKKTNVCSHSYFFLPKAYPNIWRAQLLSPESGELAHSNMYFRTSGHVMLSSSSSKKQRFSSISHQVLFTRLFIFLSLYNVQDRKHYIVSKYSFSAFFLKFPSTSVFNITKTTT